MLLLVKSRTTHLILKVIIFSMGMILIFSGNKTYGNEEGQKRGEETQVPKKTIEEVLKEYTNDLMSIPGVVGAGQSLCNGQPCIKVFVSKKTVDLQKKIPKTLEGYPVVIQKTGRFKALPDN